MIAWIRLWLAVGAVILISLILFPLHLLLLWLRHPWRNRLPRIWHKFTLWAIGVRVHVHGQAERRRPLMLAANHSSWLDILVLASVVDATFVAKAEVRDWPVFGVLARLQRSIFIKREERRQTREQADEMAARLNAGETVVLFPEGTTTDGNRLGEIKSSLFAAASSAAHLAPDRVVHVQPVAIAYTRIQGMAMGHFHRPIAAWPGDVALMPHLVGILRAGAIDVDVRFGDTVEVMAGTSRKHVSGFVREQLRDMLEKSLRGR
ncbi:MAG: 1-acyl-sn-glycerol-3-phosphate acyltransferase [Rhizobium sp.]|nr:1-acyl-sn-glycerol-3-phosphate acyltransferase [Rhizobium sp.]